MRISIRALAYFDRAMKHESIARAAEELNVAPSAIGIAIDQVETEFGMKLVHRFPAKGISPTTAGRAMHQKVRKLLEDYDGLMREGSEMRTSLSGSLKIGYYAPVAPAFMPSILRLLTKNNPQVSFSLVECNNDSAQAGLIAGEFDVILFVASNVRRGIEYHHLVDAPPFLLTQPGNAFSGRGEIDLEELADEPLVLLDLPFTSEYLRSLLDNIPAAPRIVATASGTEMIRSMVGAGIGSSILNMQPLNTTTYSDRKVTAIPIRNAPALRLVLGHAEGGQRRLVNAFVSACVGFFQSDAAARLVVPQRLATL